jgi:hypothetical protein
MTVLGACLGRLGSRAWIAGPNSIIGSPASHMHSKCTTNFAATI